MPVARNVWQPMAVSMPAAFARRRTIAQASEELSGFVVSWPVLRLAERKSGPFLSSAMPAASM